MKIRRFLPFILSLTLMMSFVLAGCSASESVSNVEADKSEATVDETETTTDKTESATDKSKSEDEVITITAATTGIAPKPYIYTDEEGNVTGYDIELLKAIFDRIDGYELEIVQTEFESIFSGIDAGEYQIGVNQMAYSLERSEKYALSYTYDATAYGILVKEDSDITSLEDIGGHKFETYSSNPWLSDYERYNEEHPDNPVEIVFSEDTSQAIVHLEDGSNDFIFQSVLTLQNYIDEYGYTDLKIIPVSLEEYQSFVSDE